MAWFCFLSEAVNVLLVMVSACIFSFAAARSAHVLPCSCTPHRCRSWLQCQLARLQCATVKAEGGAIEVLQTVNLASKDLHM